MSGAKPFRRLAGGRSLSWQWGPAVRLPAPLDRVRIERVGFTRNEGGSGGHQDVVEAAAEFAAGAHLDARWIDAFFVDEILLDVEVALSSCIRCFIGGVPADDHEFGCCVAVKAEGDFVETALGFVVDANGAFSVALEGDAAEGPSWRSNGSRRSV